MHLSPVWNHVLTFAMGCISTFLFAQVRSRYPGAQDHVHRIWFFGLGLATFTTVRADEQVVLVTAIVCGLVVLVWVLDTIGQIIRRRLESAKRS
jgi:hypothetical protein